MASAIAAGRPFQELDDEDSNRLHAAGSRFGYRDGMVTSSLAFRVGKMMRFGKAARSPLWRRTWAVLEERFFNGASFFRRDGEVRPVEVRLNPDKPFADGDTAKIVSFKQGDGWVDSKVSVRMDGIDTPESNPSEKLRRGVAYISRYLGEEHAVDPADMDALGRLVQARIVYLGKISGIVTAGFGAHFADIGVRLGPAYTRVAKKVPALCDSLDIWDRYGRIVGRIMAGGENQGEDLLAGFIEAVLPGVMAGAEGEYLAAYREKTRPYAALLRRWKADKPELHGILSAKTAPIPTRIFSKNKCKRLARLWAEFCAENPRAINDIQTMMALIGVTPPYPKYRGHLTAMDLSAELYALGRAPQVQERYGMTFDPMYIFVRPVADPNDPDRSPVYSRYPDMSGVADISEMNPPDCTAESCRAKKGKEIRLRPLS
ncbi:MAG: hypothetical protein JXA24_06280 [Proteobacteria bacterium]|nr:hypothetical protein [Pseudomonadota bacterium]